MEYNLPLTKKVKALKVWMMLKTYGTKRICETIRKDVGKASYFVDKIAKSETLEVMAPAPLSIVCF